jgi:hypothetical protein
MRSSVVPDLAASGRERCDRSGDISNALMFVSAGFATSSRPGVPDDRSRQGRRLERPSLFEAAPGTDPPDIAALIRATLARSMDRGLSRRQRIFDQRRAERKGLGLCRKRVRPQRLVAAYVRRTQQVGRISRKAQSAARRERWRITLR